MTARRDFAKKTKRKKSSSKTIVSARWKWMLLTLTCIAIAMVYYARHDVRVTQQSALLNPMHLASTITPQFEFYPARPDADAVAEKPAPKTPSQYQIQLGSFTKGSHAEEMKASLILDGYTPVITRSSTKDNHYIIKVSLGPYTDFDTANATLRKLQSGHYKGVIVRVA